MKFNIMNKIFLEAEWRKLIMANYAVEPALLQDYLPKKTELDLWNNTCYISLIGFMFCNTSLKGFKVPFHVNFEEVNLRFYVKHRTGNGDWKRGVVFIKEIVSKSIISFVAEKMYHEHYITMPMSHQWVEREWQKITYKWKFDNYWNEIYVKASKTPKFANKHSLEAFITENYWGYTKVDAEETREYSVEHPQWSIYEVKDHKMNVDVIPIYGKSFEFINHEQPDSIFLAEGSPVIVRVGNKI